MLPRVMWWSCSSNAPCPIKKLIYLPCDEFHAFLDFSAPGNLGRTKTFAVRLCELVSCDLQISCNDLERGTEEHNTYNIKNYIPCRRNETGLKGTEVIIIVRYFQICGDYVKGWPGLNTNMWAVWNVWRLVRDWEHVETTVWIMVNRKPLLSWNIFLLKLEKGGTGPHGSDQSS